MAYVRGLCLGHYYLAKRLIKQGLVTQKELIIAGKWSLTKHGSPNETAVAWFLAK